MASLGVKGRDGENFETLLERFNKTIGNTRHPKSDYWTKDVCQKSHLAKWSGNIKEK